MLSNLLEDIFPFFGASGAPCGYQLQSFCSCWRFIWAWVMQAPAKAKGAQQGGGGGCTTQPKSFLLQGITWLPLQEVRGLRQQGLPPILPGPPAALHTRILSGSLSPRATWLHLDWTRIPEEGTFSHPSSLFMKEHFIRVKDAQRLKDMSWSRNAK